VDPKTGAPLCAESSPDSVVCSLQAVQTQLDDIFAGVITSVADGTTAAAAVDSTVQSTASKLDAQLANLGKLTSGLSDEGSLSSALEKAGKSADSVSTTVDQLAENLDGVRDLATQNQKKVVSIGKQSDDLASALCGVSGDGTQPGRLSKAQVDKLRSYLVDTSCDGKDDLDPPGGWSVSLTDRLDTQTAAWQQVAAELNPDSTDLPIGKRLGELRSELKDLSASLKDASDAVGDDQDTITKINADILAARKTLASFGAEVDGTQTDYGKAQQQLEIALKQAADQAAKAQAASLDPAIKQVADEANASSTQLGKAFDASAEGLSSAADQLRNGTAQTLKKQHDDLAKQEKSDESALNDKTKAGLSSISGNVTSATRDIDSTRTSLTKDLNNVLLDLGNPKQPDKGLLGTLGKSARAADSADYQLGLASDKVSSYSSVRSQEVGGILLRQAQAEAALQRQAELPAFATDLPANTAHRTVYEFHLGGDR
jgi:trimeric autotransporter adhesin